MSFTTLRPQFEQVHLLRRQGQAAAAEMLARQIVAAAASSVDDLYCQASLLLEWNRPADALKRFDAARAQGQVPPELLVDRAVALKLLGRGEEAVTGCDEALTQAPHFAPAHLIRAESLWSLGRLDAALARPLWMPLKLAPEWRWLLGRGDSVWYPTARLFRQQAAGDWAAPFAAMEIELRKLLSQDHP